MVEDVAGSAFPQPPGNASPLSEQRSRPGRQVGSVLDRKLLREWRQARGVLAAIVGIVAVGVACFVMMASLYRNLETSRRAYYARCRMADFWVDLKKVPLAELARLREVAGIAGWRARVAFDIRVEPDSAALPVSGMALSLPDRRVPLINDIVLRRGGYFTDHAENEVIVNDAFARQHGLEPGDVIRVLLNNRLERLSIVGTALSSEFVYTVAPGAIIPDPQRYGIFYLKQSFAEEVFDFEGAANQLVGRLTPEARRHPDRVLRDLETLLEPFGVFATTPLARQPSHWYLSNEIHGLKVSVVILPAIFLSVAAVVLTILMRRTAERQRTVIGTLKALGYSDRALIVHFLKFGALVGTLGGSLGAFAAFWMAGVATGVYQQFFEFPQLVNRAYPDVIAAGIAISVGFAVFGAYRGVRDIVGLPPAVAMRPAVASVGKATALEHWGWLWKHLDSGWKMTLRNLIRQRRHSLAGLFAAAVGAALLLVTLHSRDAMLELIRFQFDKLLLSDYELTLDAEHDLAAADEVLQLPGVEQVEARFVLPCRLENAHHQRRVAVVGIPRGAQLTVPRDVSGRRIPVPPEGLLLSRKLASILDVHPGQPLILTPIRGARRPRQVFVSGLSDTYLGLTAYADFHWLNRIADEAETISSLQVKTAGTPEAERAFLQAVRERAAIRTVASIRHSKQMLIETFAEIMMVSIVMMISFAGMIFFGSVLNASLVSISERQREIATLRALGYGPWQIGSIVLRENLCLTFFGSVLGLGLGYWLCRGIDRLYDTELFRFPSIIQPHSWLWTVLLGLVFALAAHLPVQRHIHRMDWRSALNVME